MNEQNNQEEEEYEEEEIEVYEEVEEDAMLFCVPRADTQPGKQEKQRKSKYMCIRHIQR